MLALLGCSATPPEPDEAGVTTDPGGSSEDSNGDGPKLDVTPVGDLPHCWMTFYMSETEVNAAHPDCVFDLIEPDNEFAEMCVDRPVDGDCADICPADELCEGMGSAACPWTDWAERCGPYETADSCCLVLKTNVVNPTG